jgi:putative dimethyl sulfoxide reductase chaperone
MPSSNPGSRTLDGPSLGPQQSALARHRSYSLLSRLFLEGLTEALQLTVAALPPLAASLPAAFDADEAAADHHELFVLNVYPYEGIFRDEEGLLGGRMAETVTARYHEAGYAPDTAASGPDHIGYELGFLAFLCGAEADAWRDGVMAAAERVRGLQRDFLAQHLLAWLAPLVVTIGEQGQPFYTALGELALGLADEHATALGGLPEAWALPAAPPLLDAEKTGLKQIAGYLLTPVHSGLYLSRDDISALARAVELPRGFGGRQEMLANLLRAAAQYETVGTLVGELQQIAERWQAAYRAIGDSALAPFATAWAERAGETGRLLAEMGARVDEAQS